MKTRNLALLTIATIPLLGACSKTCVCSLMVGESFSQQKYDISEEECQERNAWYKSAGAIGKCEWETSFSQHLPTDPIASTSDSADETKLAINNTGNLSCTSPVSDGAGQLFVVDISKLK